MSRTFDALRKAEALRSSDTAERGRSARRCRVLSVISNKGGVGKTTIATNLAIYLRALREELPILFLGLDEQPTPDRMFALEGQSRGETVASALRAGRLDSAIRLGQYGLHYVPTSPDVSRLKREIDSLSYVQRVLARTRWDGVVVVDTKSDFEILTQNAIAASDLVIVVVKDYASLIEAERVFRMLEQLDRPRERARILLSLVDLRIKYQAGESRDILALLLSEIRARGYPLFESFLSRSPKVESLQTNPERRALSILHGAAGSLVHKQMRRLAEDVLDLLEAARPAADAPAQPEPPPGRSRIRQVLGDRLLSGRRPGV